MSRVLLSFIVHPFQCPGHSFKHPRNRSEMERSTLRTVAAMAGAVAHVSLPCNSSLSHFPIVVSAFSNAAVCCSYPSIFQSGILSSGLSCRNGFLRTKHLSFPCRGYLQHPIICSLETSRDLKSNDGSNRGELLEEELAAAKKGELSRKQVVTLLDKALQRGLDEHAVAMAATLRGFGGASLVPQRIYSLQDLRLNKIEASQFLSPTDATLNGVKRNLQLAAIAGGIAAWQSLELDQFQLLYSFVAFLFLATWDQIANGGGVEALLLDSIGRLVSPKYRDRVAQHEAGHFLVSYLMGILPKSYTLSSLDALRTLGSLNVQAGTTFVDYNFQEEIKSGKLSSQTLNRFSCVALAGIATEYLLYGVAEGGLADIQQLDSLMKGLGFTQKKADAQVRWAALNTVTLLRRHTGVQAKLAAAMEAGQSVGQCVQVIEDKLDSVPDI